MLFIYKIALNSYFIKTGLLFNSVDFDRIKMGYKNDRGIPHIAAGLKKSHFR